MRQSTINDNTHLSRYWGHKWASYSPWTNHSVWTLNCSSNADLIAQTRCSLESAVVCIMLYKKKSTFACICRSCAASNTIRQSSSIVVWKSMPSTVFTCHTGRRVLLVAPLLKLQLWLYVWITLWFVFYAGAARLCVEPTAENWRTASVAIMRLRCVKKANVFAASFSLS